MSIEDFGLGPGQRGLVVSNKVNIDLDHQFPFSEHWETRGKAWGANKTVSDAHLIFGLTYWDKLVWPILMIPLVGQPVNVWPTDFVRDVADEGLLGFAAHPVQGIVESITADAEGFSLSGRQSRDLVNAFRNTYDSLSMLNPGQWTLSNEAREVAGVIASRAQNALCIELIGAVPTVVEVRDASKFLRWREDRSDLRRRFLHSVEQTALSIQLSDEPERALEEHKKAIAATCADLIRVASEQGFTLTLSSLVLNLNMTSDRIRNYLRDWSGNVLSFGAVDPIAGVAAAIYGAWDSSLIKFYPAPGLSTGSSSVFPFSAVPKLQYPG